jgi:hypothetical protein
MKRLICAALLMCMTTSLAIAAPTPPPLASTPSAAKNLTATKNATGFVITGGVLFNTTCMSSGLQTLLANQVYWAVTWRSAPASQIACGQIIGYAPSTLQVTTANPPASIMVLTSAGLTKVTVK